MWPLAAVDAFLRAALPYDVPGLWFRQTCFGAQGGALLPELEVLPATGLGDDVCLANLQLIAAGRPAVTDVSGDSPTYPN